MALASAACWDECEVSLIFSFIQNNIFELFLQAKGGKCSWKKPNDGSEYSGTCREGKWGEGEYCYCGYCYLKPCKPIVTCKGQCQRRSPGRGWTSTSYCDK